jgi:antitoxin component YwqK of YwqJK toxin-antitoxin module
MKYFGITGLLGLMLLSCSGAGHRKAELVTVDSVLESGFRMAFQQRRADGLREGAFRMYDEHGRLYEQSTYKAGRPHGLRILYFPDGDTLSVETLVHGRHEGAYRLYHENGRVELEGQYLDNAMAGIWKRYYPSGQLMEKVTFENNQEEGPFVEYHPNGALKAEGAYRNGDFEQGELRLYNEAGELERIMDCEAGLCRTRWTAEH